MSTEFAPPIQASPHRSLVNAPTFTLGAALAWLGHHCTNRCSDALDTVGATIWYIRQPSSPWLLPDDTLIVLDLAANVIPAVQNRRLLRQINACARADGIRVCPRPGDDYANTLASIAGHTDAPKLGGELVAVASTVDGRTPRRSDRTAPGGT